MLMLHLNCQCCDKDRPVSAKDAMVCSFECIFVDIVRLMFIVMFVRIAKVTSLLAQSIKHINVSVDDEYSLSFNIYKNTISRGYYEHSTC